MHHDHSPDDIYRGERPSSPHPSDESASSGSSSSSSSSTSSIIGGRLGALAAKVEHAISRWARGVRGNASSVSSDSSSTNSTSSSSSEDSINTLTKSQIARRRRRRPSVSSLRTLQSERDIAARIMRMKALEESRQIPRMFSLYLPEALLQRDQRTPSNTLASDPLSQRLTVSSVLPEVIGKLEAATQKPAKPRRTRHRHRGPSSSRKLDGSIIPPIPDQIYDNAPTAPPPPSDILHPGLPVSRRGRKGKSREVPQRNFNFRRKHSPVPEEPTVKPQPWFLDVANPTWADLRAIGKMLHIHPLTLEDILSRDPREKLEIFSKLGYYVISFRAIESESTREKLRRETSSIGVNSVYDEAEIGEANVYLTVFNDGICCFHYTDVSEHTDRVRNRLVLLEKVINMTSDWVAYELVDSIVDSFFPVLERIDREVGHIENLVFSSDYQQYHCPLEPPAEAPSSPPMATSEKGSSVDDTGSSEKDEKYAVTPAQQIRNSFRPRFTTPQPTAALLVWRIRRFFGHIKTPSLFNKDAKEPQLSATQLTLWRMAKTRKLVTALGRLLTAKSDVVTQIRKRLVRAVKEAPGRKIDGVERGKAPKDGHLTSDDFDIAIYLGDVQDHILTLQHSLAHYERMLSQSHPTYLAQLRSKSEAAKSGTDMNLLYLTVVSLSVLCMQTLTGLFSLNVNVPRNTPDGPNHTVFGIVVGLACIILCTYLAFVRHWWLQAKRRHRRQL